MVGAPSGGGESDGPEEETAVHGETVREEADAKDVAAPDMSPGGPMTDIAQRIRFQGEQTDDAVEAGALQREAAEERNERRKKGNERLERIAGAERRAAQHAELIRLK